MIHNDQNTARAAPVTSPSADTVRLLFIVEGTNDVEFLRRISLILHARDSSLPNLATMESQGQLIFVPVGGGRISAWADRLAPLARPEFHLYDHELPPETDHRRDAAAAVNRRPGCRAVLTRKRSLENYLHPAAISAAAGIEVEFDDFDCVAAIVAKKLYQRRPGERPWELHSQRARSRMTHRAKHWLNTEAVARMTADLLSQRDPEGEVISWFAEIWRLIQSV